MEGFSASSLKGAHKGSLKTRLLFAPLVSLLCFALLGLLVLHLIDSSMRNSREKLLISVVETASGVLKRYQTQETEGAISREEAQKRALQTLKGIRYAGAEYLWVNDTGQPYPTMIMHPTVPSLDGQVLNRETFNKATRMYSVDGSFSETLDKANLFQSFVRIVARHGQGFVAYEWPKPTQNGVTSELYPKLSYVKTFEPWNWVIGTGVYIDDLRASYWQLAGVVLGFLALVSLVTLAVALHSRRRLLNEIGGELTDAVGATVQIASGNLASRIGNDRTPSGSMLASLESMRAELDALASAIVRNSHALSSDMAALTADASSMGTRLSLQKDTFDEVRGAVEQMQAQMLVLADLANETETSTQSIAQRSVDGAATMNETMADMRRIAAIIERSSGDVQVFSEQARNVGNFVGLIREIADQTNLLALNAAIEAARAGDAGRGFAVVADEVRNLAERTALATREISTTVSQIQQKVLGVVTEMQSATPVAQSGVETASKTVDMLNDFRHAADDVFNKMNAFTRIVSQEVERSRSVVNTVGQSIEITEQAVQMVDGASRVAAKADHTAEELKRQASRFRVTQSLDLQNSVAMTQNVALPWSSRLMVGEPSIDAQHKRLVELFNELHEALHGSLPQEKIAQILVALLEYTQFHFAHEASLMKKFGFPGQKAHLAMHDELVKAALEYKRRFEAGEAIGVDLVNFVRDWLTHHILKTDRQLADFIKQSAQSGPPATGKPPRKPR